MSEAVKVKVCGLRSLENSLECVEAGVDMLGFNLWPGSKRHIAFDDAKEWLGELEGKVERVALFVNAEGREIEAIWESGLVDLVQLHGDEKPELCQGLVDAGISVMRAIRVREESDLDEIPAYPGERILLDAFVKGAFGGTGETFDWSLARLAAERFPDRKIVLSGGLNPENVAEAVSQACPWGVDVASGVESAAGVKDPVKVRSLVAAAKG